MFNFLRDLERKQVRLCLNENKCLYSQIIKDYVENLYNLIYFNTYKKILCFLLKGEKSGQAHALALSLYILKLLKANKKN